MMKRKFFLGRIWDSINQNWGVAVGFLVLLFLIPVAITVSNTKLSNSPTSSADSSKPLVKISPASGMGLSQMFVAEVTDNNVDALDTVQVWWGENDPLNAEGSTHFVNADFVRIDNTWKLKVLNRSTNGNEFVITYLDPNNDLNSNLSKVYYLPVLVKGEYIQNTSDVVSASAVLKFVNVNKISANQIKFDVQVDFRSNFGPKNIKTYMYAQRNSSAGNTTSSVDSNIWTQVGSWTVAQPQTGAVVNQKPKFQSVPSSKATVGSNYIYSIIATDPENDTLTYSVPTKPGFLNLSGNILSGIPSATDKGNKNVTVVVKDSAGNSISLSWTLVVSEAVVPTTIPTIVVSTTVAPTIVTVTPSGSGIIAPKLNAETPTGNIYETRPKISAIFENGSGEVVMSTLKVYLDDKEISSDTANFVKTGNSFSYTPPQTLALGLHKVRVVISGADAVSDKGVLDTVWNFTLSDLPTGASDNSQSKETNKIQLPIIGLKVDPWLGTIIIALFVLLLFAILIFAILMLIKLLRKEDDEVTQITKYYQQNNPEPNPEILPVPAPAVVPTPEVKTEIKQDLIQTPLEPFAPTMDTNIVAEPVSPQASNSNFAGQMYTMPEETMPVSQPITNVNTGYSFDAYTPPSQATDLQTQSMDSQVQPTDSQTHLYGVSEKNTALDTSTDISSLPQPADTQSAQTDLYVHEDQTNTTSKSEPYDPFK